jgi:alkanesulfonate monooxygenase SsuD/methylene tetrahydromethanopterin reductase-like flavin-dependent oxidoreductase (luciferase family)
MWWWYKGISEFHLKWEMTHLSPEKQAAAFPLLQARARGEFDITEFDREDMVVVGTPDECLTKLARYEEAGVDQLLCYLNFGYLPHDAVMKSIELLGTRVIPELRKRGANGIAAGLDAGIQRAEAQVSAKSA